MKRARDIIDFPDDVNDIKEFLNSKSIYFIMIECNVLWEWFSDDVYSAGFMTVDNETLTKFVEWLKE